MKSIILSCIVVLCICSYVIPAEKSVENPIYDGCYLCYQHHQFVTFKGKDSPEMQNRALERFACKVYAVMPDCNPWNYSELIFINKLD